MCEYGQAFSHTPHQFPGISILLVSGTFFMLPIRYEYIIN